MEKIVITGYGVKCPNGYSKDHFKKSLEKGTFDLSYYATALGRNIVVGRVPDEETAPFHTSKYSRVTRLGLAAAKEAIAMANVPTDGSLRIAVIVGSAAGPTEETTKITLTCHDTNLRRYPLLGIGLMNYHSTGSAIIGEFGLEAKAFTLASACNSSSDALYMASLLLKNGEADICIAGGSDAPLCEPVLYGFAKAQMAETDVRIEDAGIPFSRRDRFIISEGAGIVILERDSVATARKARKFGELLGVDSNNDGTSAFSSDATGEKMKKVVQDVLLGMEPSYINSQALGLTQNDAIELAVRQSLFQGDIPITSIKGVTGHPFGSAGAIQLIASLLSLEFGFIPNTKANTFTRGLDVVTEPIYKHIDSVCITTHGFGGNNSCILVGNSLRQGQNSG